VSNSLAFLLWSAGMFAVALGWLRLTAIEIVRLAVEIDEGDLPAESARTDILRGLYDFPALIAALAVALLFGFIRVRADELLATVVIIAGTTGLFMISWRHVGVKAGALARERGIAIRFGGKVLGSAQ
jgi:hypothetical protein